MEVAQSQGGRFWEENVQRNSHWEMKWWLSSQELWGERTSKGNGGRKLGMEKMGWAGWCNGEGIFNSRWDGKEICSKLIVSPLHVFWATAVLILEAKTKVFLLQSTVFLQVDQDFWQDTIHLLWANLTVQYLKSSENNVLCLQKLMVNFRILSFFGFAVYIILKNWFGQEECKYSIATLQECIFLLLWKSGLSHFFLCISWNTKTHHSNNIFFFLWICTRLQALRWFCQTVVWH